MSKIPSGPLLAQLLEEPQWIWSVVPFLAYKTQYSSDGGYSATPYKDGVAQTVAPFPIPPDVGRVTIYSASYFPGSVSDDGVTLKLNGETFSGVPVSAPLPTTGGEIHRIDTFIRDDGSSVTKEWRNSPIANFNLGAGDLGPFTQIQRYLTVIPSQIGVSFRNVFASGLDTTLHFDLVTQGTPSPTLNTWTVAIVQATNTTNQPFHTFNPTTDSRGPGEVSPIASGVHVDLPWDGKNATGTQVAGDFTWVLAANATIPGGTAGAAARTNYRLDQQTTKGVRITNAAANDFDPTAGENTTLKFDVETTGLTRPTTNWNVTVLDSSNTTFQQFSGSDASGNNITHVTLGPWLGNNTAGNVISGPFKWVIAANATTPDSPIEKAANVTLDSSAGGPTIEILENKPGGARLASGKSLDGKSASTDAEFEAQLNKVCRDDKVLVRLSGVPTSGETTDVSLKLSLGNSNERALTLQRRDKVFEAVVDLRALENESASLATFHTIDASEPVNDTNEFGEQLRAQGFQQAGRGFEGELLALFTRPRDILLASPKYGTRDFESLDSCKTSPEQVMDAGYHVLRVRYTPPNASDIPIESTLRAKKQAKSLYIGGHGDFYGLATPRVSFYKRITGFQSELKPGAWKDLRTVIFGACTILNLNNYKNNETYQVIASPPGVAIPIGEIPSYSPARVVDAATRGQAVVLGYASTAPAGPFGFIRRAALLQFDTKILRQYFANLGTAPTDRPRTSPISWCRANAAIDFNDNACAIDDRGYYYIKYKIRAARSWGRAFEEHYDRAIVFVPRERWDLPFKADHRPEILIPLENVFLRD